MMKIKVLALLLLLLLVQSSAAICRFEGFPKPIKLQDPNLSEPKLDRKLHGGNVTIRLHKKGHTRIFEGRMHENFRYFLRKGGGKGKGSGRKGGRSADRHPRNAKRNASASLPALSSCFFISASVALMLFLPLIMF